jgi:hypothetical protein
MSIGSRRLLAASRNLPGQWLMTKVKSAGEIMRELGERSYC